MPEEGKNVNTEFNSVLESDFGGIANIVDVLDQGPIEIPDEEDVVQKQETIEKKEDIAPEGAKQELITIEEEQDEEEKEEIVEEISQEKTKETPSEQDLDPPPPSADTDKYKLFAQELVSEGLFDEFSDEEWEEFKEDGDQVAALKSLFNKKVADIEKSYEESLSDEDRDIYRGKKLGVPLDEVGALNSVIGTLNSITDESLEENVQTQKDIVKLYYKKTSPRLSDVKVDKIIKGLEDAGELFDESKTSKEDLKGVLKDEKKEIYAKEEKKTQQIEEDRKKQLSDLRNTIDNTDEIVPGQKISSKMKKALFDTMTKPVAKDEQGNPINKANFVRNKNPLKFDIVFNYLLELGLFDTDNKGNFKPKVDKLTKQIKTEVTKSAFKKMMDKDKPNVGTFTDKSKSAKRTGSIFGTEFEPNVS